jgi:dTDP-4-dehydrorhamnose 3,5-epimerase
MENELNLDASFVGSLKDSQTVNTQGESISQLISGVKVFKTINHVDHRGRVFEIFPGQNDYWEDPVVYCYAFTIKVNTGKGWGLHEKKIDRYTLISGEALTVLYGARLDSPTHGLIQKVYLSGEGFRQLSIPKGVWHITLNIGTEEVFLINHPTQVYKHENPDRLLLDWDTNEIPVDLAQFFPIQLANGGKISN